MKTIKNELNYSNNIKSNLMFVSQNIKENNVNIQINKQILENKNSTNDYKMKEKYIHMPSDIRPKSCTVGCGVQIY